MEWCGVVCFSLVGGKSMVSGRFRVPSCILVVFSKMISPPRAKSDVVRIPYSMNN
jgi:hypothetical protein